MQAERKIEALEKENAELREEVEGLKTKCAQLEVILHDKTDMNIISEGLNRLKNSDFSSKFQTLKSNSFRSRRGKYIIKNANKGQLAFLSSQQQLVNSGSKVLFPNIF